MGGVFASLCSTQAEISILELDRDRHHHKPSAANYAVCDLGTSTMAHRELEHRDKYVVDPETVKILGIWDSVTVSALLFTAVATPYDVAFLNSDVVDFMYVTNRCVDGIFVFDLFLQFFLMYQDSAGKWVGVHKKIVKHYLSTWFVVDIVSVVPVDLISQQTNNDDLSNLEAVRVVRLLRLLKLLRVFRASRVVKRWQSSIPFSQRKTTMLSFLTTLLVISHWLACLFGMCDNVASPTDKTWVDALHQRYFYTSEYQHKSDIPAWDVYVGALHWSVSTLTSIGYGDVVSYNTTERCVEVVVMVGGGCFWAYLIGSICSLASDFEAEEFRTRMDSLNKMLESSNVPSSLRRKCRSYLSQKTKANQLGKLKALIGAMSPAISSELVVAVSVQWVDQVWYFRTLCCEFLVDLTQAMGSKAFAAKEVFGHPWTLYVMVKGAAARKNRILLGGDVWGFEDLLLSSWQLLDYHSSVGLAFVEVMDLRRKQLIAILHKYPDEARTIRKAYVACVFRAGVLMEARRRLKKERKPNQVAAFLAWSEMVENRDVGGNEDIPTFANIPASPSGVVMTSEKDRDPNESFDADERGDSQTQVLASVIGLGATPKSTPYSTPAAAAPDIGAVVDKMAEQVQMIKSIVKARCCVNLDGFSGADKEQVRMLLREVHEGATL
mmetsp:Transcript_13291/g.33203  ORF Transcript_13291/g.33203 Transcript_13291/m.33203 type:complete len:665 (-) Transcript_13291:134-2128(-)